jgi:hypothetical protein
MRSIGRCRAYTSTLVQPTGRRATLSRPLGPCQNVRLEPPVACAAPGLILCYVNQVRLHRSAFKHRVTAERIEHAFGNSISVADLDPDSDPPKVLIIGPDPSGRLLELIALVLADDELLVIHAMPLRPTFYSLLPDPTE